MKNEFVFNDVVERIKTICELDSYISVADKLGMSGTAFANLKKRGSIPYDKVLMLANSLNVSFDWVLTGKGEMLKGNQAEQEWGGIEERRVTYKTPLKLENMLEGLTERQKMLVLADIEEKKQLNEMKAMFAQLQGVKEGK